MTPFPSREFRHDALLFASDEELNEMLVPFVRDGLAAGDAVMLACRERTTALLPAAVLDHPAAHVVDRGFVYYRPAGAIAEVQTFLDDMLDDGVDRVRLVGEVPYGTDPTGWEPWAEYEAMINLLFVDYPAWHLCLYDTRRLPRPVLAIADDTHRYLRTPTAIVPSPRFVAPMEYLRRYHREHPDPLEHSTPEVDLSNVEHPAALGAVRRGLSTTIAAVAPSTVVEEFTLAVNEIVTNALRHGRPPIRLKLWTTPQRSLCSVTDAGTGVDDRLAGYRPPPGRDPVQGGMGLWLVRQLCDTVQLTSSDGGFTALLGIWHRPHAA